MLFDRGQKVGRVGRFAREFRQVGCKKEKVREGCGSKCVEGF